MVLHKFRHRPSVTFKSKFTPASFPLRGKAVQYGLYRTDYRAPYGITSLRHSSVLVPCNRRGTGNIVAGGDMDRETPVSVAMDFPSFELQYNFEA